MVAETYVAELASVLCARAVCIYAMLSIFTMCKKLYSTFHSHDHRMLLKMHYAGLPFSSAPPVYLTHLQMVLCNARPSLQ